MQLVVQTWSSGTRGVLLLILHANISRYHCNNITNVTMIVSKLLFFYYVDNFTYFNAFNNNFRLIYIIYCPFKTHKNKHALL